MSSVDRLIDGISQHLFGICPSEHAISSSLNQCRIKDGARGLRLVHTGDATSVCFRSSVGYALRVKIGESAALTWRNAEECLIQIGRMAFT
jgi:hypothetical protein